MSAIEDVAEEQFNQQMKWGQQKHPDGTRQDEYDESAAVARKFETEAIDRRVHK